LPTINGNNNANTINGGLANDTINARGGHDLVYAGGGADYVDGGLGNDNLFGESGADTLLGGEGNDALDGGADNDVLNGGNGIDTAVFSSGAAVTVNLTTGVAIGQGIDTLINIERVVGSSLDDTITGNALANRLEGGAGNDLFFATTGADEILGGAGIDTYSYANVSAGAIANLGYGSFIGGVQNGTIQGIENLIGSAFGDQLIGDVGANRIDGGQGNDFLSGWAGADTLIANGGNDTITGGAGDDVIIVGVNAASVLIADFNQFDTDVIDLTAFGFDSAGQSAYWDATGGQSGANYVMTLTGLLGEIKTITLENFDGANLTTASFINGTQDLLPSRPVVPGNGVGDDFVIVAQAGTCVVINGFEDGLDQIDLTLMGFDSNFVSPDWFGYSAQDGVDTVLRFWDNNGGYFEVLITDFDILNLDITDFILGP
jgi:Ca2+-binding RTX toxin-like protein